MNRRRSAVLAIIALSLLAGLATGSSFFFTVAYAFIGLLALSFVLAWAGVSWLQVQRTTHTRRAQVSGCVEETFLLRNTALLPKLWVEVYDQSDLLGHRASHVISGLGPRAVASWRTRTLCVQRGVFRLGPLRVVAADPFGLFQAERRIDATSPLVVYPFTATLADFPLPAGVLPGGEALRRRTHHVTTNAAAVRDYAPGDSLNRIHWPSTARKNRLIVKEFELDPLADIWIFLDAERAVHVGEHTLDEAGIEAGPQSGVPPVAIPPTTEEYAVAAAASLAAHFLHHERSVGLAVHGRHPQLVHAGRGPRQLARILETLAVLEARGTLTFDRVLELYGNQLARGTAAILITPSPRESWVAAALSLAQRSVQVVVVLIDAASFGGRPGAQAVAAQMALAAIPVYLIRLGDDLPAALGQRYL